MKQIEVQIMGQSYMLGSPDDGEKDMLAAAARVDQAMCRIRDVGKTKARDRIAVLAALNLAYELEHRDAPSGSQGAQAMQSDWDEESVAKARVLLARLDTALNLDGQLI
jgi:cell division protein ZapA